MLTIQNYVRAESLEQAWELCQKKQNRLLGGMMWMRLANQTIHTAIDLSGLGLDQIEETENAFIIGAMATLRQFELHQGLKAYTNGANEKAVGSIVGVQFRNLATIGGSVWGRFGFSDVLTLLLAMDTSVELYKGGLIPLSQFVKMKPDRDLLVRVIIHKTPGTFEYLSVRASRTDFPILTCAAASINRTLKVSIGARPGKAVLLEKNGVPSPELAADFARYAAETVVTGTNSRAGAEYRTRLVRVLTERAILSLLPQKLSQEGSQYAD